MACRTGLKSWPEGGRLTAFERGTIPMTDVRCNEVHEAFACPNCGERDADNLVNSADGDDLVFCETCGCTYALDLRGPAHEPGEGKPVVVICGPGGKP
jgi:hypothetical protein